jgi:hypothetical protein
MSGMGESVANAAIPFQVRLLCANSGHPRLLVPNRIDYATWATRIGGGGCPHEPGECIDFAGDTDQTNSNLGYKSPRSVPLA